MVCFRTPDGIPLQTERVEGLKYDRLHSAFSTQLLCLIKRNFCLNSLKAFRGPFKTPAAIQDRLGQLHFMTV